MRKGFLYEEKRKYFPIYEEAVSHIYDFATALVKFPYIWGKFSFLFYQCTLGACNFHSTRLKMVMTNPRQPGILWSQWLNRRKVRQIKSIAKWHYLKKLPVKGTLRQVFYLLRSPLLLWPHIPILQKVKGAIVHKAGRKYQHDWLWSPVYKLYTSRDDI